MLFWCGTCKINDTAAPTALISSPQYYIGFITSSDNKAVKTILPLHNTVHSLASSVYPSLRIPAMFCPWKAWKYLAVLHHCLALCVLDMLNSPLRQTAEPVCKCVSWALTLFFSLSWRLLPWGSSLHGCTREALESGLTHYSTYTVYVRVCHSMEHLLPGVTASYSGIDPVWLLVSCIYTLPLKGSQQSTPDTWYRQLSW